MVVLCTTPRATTVGIDPLTGRHFLVSVSLSSLSPSPGPHRRGHADAEALPSASEH